VRTHWTKILKFGLNDGLSGRPQCLSPIHINPFVVYASEQFHAREPVTPVRLASWLREQYHVNIVPMSLESS
jgi:hypothetical protein